MAEATGDVGSSALVNFLSDPATLIGLGVVAAGTAYYLSSRTAPITCPVPLANQSVEIPGGEYIRRSALVKTDELEKYYIDDCKTLYDCFQRGKRLSGGGSQCLGWRPGPKQPYKWITYSQVEDFATTFGAGLARLGVETGQESFVGIYARNCVEWVVTEQSCNYYSRVLVPLYDTLGPNAVTYIMNQTTLPVVVCEGVKIPLLIKQASQCPSLKLIIKIGDEVTEEEKTSLEECGLTIYSMEEVKKIGREDPVDLVLPSEDCLATLCYTSGTTGNPKGVMLTNCNMVSNMAAVYQQLNTRYDFMKNDVHVSYLPLAHMFEREVHVLMFMLGCQIGFFRGDVKELVDDIQELKPTIFVSVPRLLNRIYDKVISGVSASPVKKFLFERAMAAKMGELQRGIVRKDSWWDWLIFNKVQKSLGGRARFIITGSAPISPKVLDFLRCAFGCTVFEGYGQTECTAGATLTLPGDTTAGHVGVPLPCNHVKLVDVPEMNYFAKEAEGEVCYKGHNVMTGYYKNEEKTRETIDEDGWLHSGDIGRWQPNGTLKIIDRKKNIFKLSQGEYIAPEKIENIYIFSVYVAQAYVHGDSLKPALVALIVPDEEVLMKWAQENGVEGTFEELCQKEEVRKMIHADIIRLGKENGLHSFEQAKAIELVSDIFSVENNCLTPTFKLRRPSLKATHMETFVRLYSQLPP